MSFKVKCSQIALVGEKRACVEFEGIGLDKGYRIEITGPAETIRIHTVGTIYRIDEREVDEPEASPQEGS